MITLALDASTYRGTVAVLDGSRVTAQTTAAMKGTDAERLMPAVLQALLEAGTTLGRVDRVVCGSGPGSFTSLRIAASIAKGIAVGRGIPLFAVSSLALIVAANAADAEGSERFLAVQDALRGESFIAEFELAQGIVRQRSGPRLVPTPEIPSHADSMGARPVGPEQPDHWMPHARGVARVLDAIIAAGPVAIATWEPMYGRLAEAQVKWEAAHGRALQG